MNAPRVLLIDNYDSFTYNLVQAFLVLGAEVIVHRNDQITVDEARALAPTHLVISPGPGRPDDAGVSLEMIAAFENDIPVLGVCLGHQSLVQHYGGEIISAQRLMHGKTSVIHHGGRGVFAQLANPLTATRYHSLIVAREALPRDFEITAWTETEDGEIDEIMGLIHTPTGAEGVQFHPESILSEHGHAMLRTFLARCGEPVGEGAVR